LNATAIPGFLKYPGLVVEKNPGFGFGKTQVGNTTQHRTDATVYLHTCWKIFSFSLDMFCFRVFSELNRHRVGFRPVNDQQRIRTKRGAKETSCSASQWDEIKICAVLSC